MTAELAQRDDGFGISKAQARTLNFAAAQEVEPALGTIGYQARVWAQVSLPYLDPGNTPYWERRNGGVSLTMRPALLTNTDGTRYEGYAYGMLPRHALTWLATEAVRTQDPVIQLGSSMNNFMTNIGLHRGGRDARRLNEQLKRLFGSQLSVQGLGENAAGHGEKTKYFQIADEFNLWFASRDLNDEPSSVALWTSEVTLSDAFFRSIIDSPVPVNLDAMRALGSSPMRTDIYLWVAWRMYSLRSVTRIKWLDLNYQFGAQYTNIRQFRAAFIRNLNQVKIVYPELKVETTTEFLILYPSKTPVAPTKPRRLELI
jgi:hypothetical protein